MSENCLSVIQCRTSTAMRCISGMAALAPPTANSDISPKVQISVQTGLVSLFMLDSCLGSPAQEIGDADAEGCRDQQHHLEREPQQPDCNENREHEDEADHVAAL